MKTTQNFKYEACEKCEAAPGESCVTKAGAKCKPHAGRPELVDPASGKPPTNAGRAHWLRTRKAYKPRGTVTLTPPVATPAKTQARKARKAKLALKRRNGADSIARGTELSKVRAKAARRAERMALNANNARARAEARAQIASEVRKAKAS